MIRGEVDSDSYTPTPVGFRRFFYSFKPITREQVQETLLNI